MRIQHLAVVSVIMMLLALGAGGAAAQEPADAGAQAVVGSELTYQGQLTRNNSPVNGLCDFNFALFDALSGGTQIGGWLSRTNVNVTNGVFTVVLDFGAAAFRGDARWLQMTVRCPAGSGSYTTLTPRQPMTAVPYAIGLRPQAHIEGNAEWGLIIANNSRAAASGIRGLTSSPTGQGVYGWNTSPSATGDGIGVLGRSDSADGRGVLGYNHGGGTGVYGLGSTGVYGRSAAQSGLVYGVIGSVSSPDGYGGYFSGRLHTTSHSSAGGTKSFRIDHPLDPAGSYLYHFSVESPEVQNLYNGQVTLDADGAAWVELPAYFEAINAPPYTYQLTAIGAAMPNLHVAVEVAGNRFHIAGGVPAKKVSWQVTGVRDDPFLRDHRPTAETVKPAEKQSTYVYPQGYGQPESLGEDFAILSAEFDLNMEDPR